MAYHGQPLTNGILSLPTRTQDPELDYNQTASLSDVGSANQTPRRSSDMTETGGVSDARNGLWSAPSMENEEEIFVKLHRGALAMLPLRLQQNLKQMYEERYARLRRENPNLRVMPGDYWITPARQSFQQAVLPPAPTRAPRAPTPLLALPQRLVSSAAYQDGFRDGYDACHSLAQANTYIQSYMQTPKHIPWSAQPARPQNGSESAPPVNFSRRQVRQHKTEDEQAETRFRVINGYHLPLPANLEFTQQHPNARLRGGRRLKSLSIRPVASSLRKSAKRSLSRINKWVKE